MNNPAIVKVAGREVERIEYRQEPVITFKMMDELHERPEGTAGRNFRKNRGRFIEGEDFFDVPFDEWEGLLVRRGTSNQTGLVVNETENQNARGGHRGNMTFLTQSGYLLLVKSFSDDLSWQIQRELVRAYFIAKRGGRGRKYDPEMERIKRMEREIKIVNSIHRKQDTIHNAAKRISEGKATLEEYAGTPDLQDAIREKIDAMPDYRFGARDYTTELAEDVLEWIKDRVLDGGFKRRKGVPVFSAREAYNRFSGRRGMKMRHMRPALQVLVEFGLINPLPAPQKKRGRPASQAYECTQKAIQEATAPVVPLTAHPAKKDGDQ
jgi:hypothetical protein